MSFIKLVWDGFWVLFWGGLFLLWASIGGLGCIPEVEPNLEHELGIVARGSSLQGHTRFEKVDVDGVECVVGYGYKWGGAPSCNWDKYNKSTP